ncbi:MAG TPA: ATP-binding protein [Bacillota bacterium]|nr:ATP-binding protein [Bacillota bacterium]
MRNARLVANLIRQVVRIIPVLFLSARKVAGALLRPLFRQISKRFRVSITFKAVSVYTLVFFSILSLFGLAVVTAFSLYYLSDLKSSLETSEKQAVALIRENNSLARSRVKNFADTAGLTVVFLDQQAGVTFSSGGAKEISDYEKEHEGGLFFSLDQYLNLKVSTGLQDKELYYVLVSGSLEPGERALAALAAWIGISVLAALLITIIIGSRNLKKMLKPVDDMIATARSVSARDLHTRLNVVASHDELKELAETFNEMLERIQVSYELQNQFVSDASHELRTPIAVVQGYANMLRRWGKEDREVLDEAVVAISNEAENMKELVEKLLFLARADKDTLKLEKTEFSLTELVEEVLRDTRLIAREHQVSGGTDEASSLATVQADRGLIKQAMRIFVDNSIKHTPPGGTITIRGTVGHSRIILSVQDSGAGIPPEDLPHIFNRFYKCDKSRTRDAGGTGLGLSIAKWIVEKHQGLIRVESKLNQGTKVTVTIPVLN